MISLSQYGPWAVIPGGSEGVGAAFAHNLARDGFNLVLIARKPEPLEETAHAVRAQHGVEVRTLSLDLTAPDMLDRIRQVTDDVEVGMLVYNAGANHRTGEFLTGSLEDALRVVRLNAVGQTSLCYHYGQHMVARRRGGIILIGSIAGSAGAASVVIYSGAKAFAQMFAEGLWYEFRYHGVDVVYVPLGTTDTPAMARLGLQHDPSEVDDPDDMAKLALANIANGPVYVPPHLAEAFQHFASMPRREATEALSQFVLARTGVTLSADSERRLQEAGE